MTATIPARRSAELLGHLETRILSGGSLTKDEALFISSLRGQAVFELFACANRIRTAFRSNAVDICAIVNARSGGCPEDCAYCAQSTRNSSSPAAFPLLDEARVLNKASEAMDGGARRFCIVTSGRKTSRRDLSAIVSMIGGIRKIGLLPCSTLGLLTREELLTLKAGGLERFHHNIETSERFFPRICTTHSYSDKMKTIAAVKAAGLSLCSGGIFGLGETWRDRVDMAIALRDINPDSVPINFLTPIPGTRLGRRKTLPPMEALKIISLFRFLLPDKEIRICGGRMQTLHELNAFIFLAGADGILSGNYLTTSGRRLEDDTRLIRSLGLEVMDRAGSRRRI
jgi:biotin synthase